MPLHQRASKGHRERGRVDTRGRPPRLRAMSYPDFLLDKRVLQRNLEKGLVKKRELEKLLAKLPDVANQAEALSAADDDDDSED